MRIRTQGEYGMCIVQCLPALCERACLVEHYHLQPSSLKHMAHMYPQSTNSRESTTTTCGLRDMSGALMHVSTAYEQIVWPSSNTVRCEA